MGTIRKDLFEMQKFVDDATSNIKLFDAGEKTRRSSKGSAEGKVTAMRHRAMSGKKPPTKYLSPLKNGDITKLKTQVGAGNVQDLGIAKVGVSKGNPFGIHTAGLSAKPKDPNPQNLDKKTKYINPGMDTFKSNISLLAKTAVTGLTGAADKIIDTVKSASQQGAVNRAVLSGDTGDVIKASTPKPSEKKTMIKTPANTPPPKINPYRKP